MAAKLTPWYPGSVKPKREGHYRVKREMWGRFGFKESVHLLLFVDGRWHYPLNSRLGFPGSLANMSAPSFWRGLASDPSKA